MPTKQDLESKGPTELAVLCQRVAENPSQYPAPISAEASKLFREWVSLQTAPDPDYPKQQRIEEQRRNLKGRMVQFLSTIA